VQVSRDLKEIHMGRDLKESPAAEIVEDRAVAALQVARALEGEHRGEYLMVEMASRNFVVAPTASEVHRRFLEEFGAQADGFCMRIGASPFAAA
jgi:hypothetical protein